MEETWYDVYRNTPESERGYYVYMWFEQGVPVYVGMGSGNRWRNTSNRSKTLRDYIKGKDIQKMVVVPNLPSILALRVEHQIKEELKSRGFTLIDGEGDPDERKRRQREGIRRAIESGVHFGRAAKEVDVSLMPGETVDQACKRLGISRATYYRKVNA